MTYIDGEVRYKYKKYSSQGKPTFIGGLVMRQEKGVRGIIGIECWDKHRIQYMEYYKLDEDKVTFVEKIK
ncbi:hypothetical protein C9J19_20245 [Photobacterium phosphoreum]|uniref:hypothetical protein n=1 Tax=Photobacterium phosphoreum TaxID=659 RepID=UPI000D17B361|nr:hypothetical protein [Photobacterium phosphoreum]PSW24295.1 hypothetical protein C9J19_20245 [Photobacterium phosphoreum]